MIPNTEQPFHGVYAATVCPLKPDFTIDNDGLARHVAAVTNDTGIVGVLCNGHAGENFLLSREQKRRVVEVVSKTIGDRAVVVSGVNAESSLEASLHATDAQTAGADAIMVFAPNSWAMPKDPGTAIQHHRLIIGATSLPVMLFQASVNAGDMAYAPSLLERLVRLPRVVAIKEGSWEVAAYEANRRLIKRVAPEVAVMGSGDEHLLASFMVGSEGSLVSLAVLIPETIASLFAAAQAGDWEAARRHHETIYPLAKAIYATPPGVLATARLKACLKLMGKIEHDTVQPPIGPLSDEEVTRLRITLEQTGLI